MYVEFVRNRSSSPAVLLRESYREQGRVKKRTLANLSSWPRERVEALRTVLKGGAAVENLKGAFEIVRTSPYGHVAAVHGTARRLELPRLLSPQGSRYRDLAVAMTVARVVDPQSRLATVPGLGGERQLSTLGETLGLESADIGDLRATMGWLFARQREIEGVLVRRVLRDGGSVLCDVTEPYFGDSPEVANLLALLCSPDGCPVAVEIGVAGGRDGAAVQAQVERFRR